MILQSSTRMAPPRNLQAPPKRFNQLRHEHLDYLPSTVNINRGAASKTSQIPDLNGPPIIKKDTFEDILTDVETLATPKKAGQICQCGYINTDCVRKTSRFHMEQTP